MDQVENACSPGSELPLPKNSMENQDFYAISIGLGATDDPYLNLALNTDRYKNGSANQWNKFWCGAEYNGATRTPRCEPDGMTLTQSGPASYYYVKAGVELIFLKR